MEIGKMEKVMVTEQKFGEMEESIPENLKMMNPTVKELFFIQTGLNMLVDGKKGSDTEKVH